LSARGPAVLRLARALAGEGVVPEPAAPLRTWRPEGSVVLARVRGLVDRLRRPLAFAGRTIDALARPLANRPLLAVAWLLLPVPLLRLAAAPAGAAAAFGLAGLAAVLALAGSLHEGREHTIVLRALLVGFALRIVLGLAIEARGGFPDEIGIYHPLAADAAASWRAGGTSLLPGHAIVENRAAYFYLLSGAYGLAGPTMLVGRVLGALVGLAAAVVAGEVARPLGGRRAAALAVAVMALHPEHAFWSATLSRDSLTTLLVLAALALVLRRPGRLLRGNLLVVAVPLALLTMNAFVVAGVLAAALVVLALGEAVAGVGRSPWSWLRAGIAVGIAGGALLVVGLRYGPWFDPGAIDLVRRLDFGLEPDILPGFAVEGGLDVLALLAAGIPHALLAPFPWDAVDAHRAAYGVLALGGATVTLTGIAGLAIGARRRPGATGPLLAFAIPMLAALAVLEANTGILLRHRLPLTAVLAVGAAAWWAGRRTAEEPA
jgi:hypothetical protein